MPYLNEVDSALCPRKSADQASDPISWIAENPAHTPCLQALPDEICDGVGHDGLLSGIKR
jgi:hypothetical protein